MAASLTLPVVTASFERLGPATPTSPIVLSVPHAGRDYPAALLERLRVPPRLLLPLEDRLVDTVARAAWGGETLLIANRARAWIDLNRGEQDRDPRVDDGAPRAGSSPASVRVRGGLGLIPRRAAAGTELWSRRWSADEVTARIRADHRPYHAALSAALAAARARFGVAVLLDLHSMPPLPGRGAARVVIGDRFGRSASSRIVARVEGCARRAGLTTALNTPYAGGHILERHAAPDRGIHAVQLELDRSLYLNGALDACGGGLAGTAVLLRDILDALGDELCAAAIAAE